MTEAGGTELLDPQRAFAAMGEPTRFRILAVLAESPRTVGGVAEAIGALQPQTTKHLQALAAAGLIRVHQLGRRRVARLDRAAFADLSRRLGEWAQADPDDEVLESYERAIAAEGARPAGSRALSFRRRFAAPVDALWRAWTDPAVAARWWAPRHFEVAEFDVAPVAGAPIRVVLAEPGGATYRSQGAVVEAEPTHRLVFELAPLDEAGEPLFRAVHTVTFAAGATSALELRIDVTGTRPEAVAALAGLEPGWTQLLERLAGVFAP